VIRPGLTLLLWVAIVVVVILSNAIGDTWIASRLPVMAVQWYKVLVPLPYVLLLAVIHARRTRGPRWLGAALLAAILWSSSTVLADFFYERVTFGEEPAGFLNRFTFWWGAPYPLLVIALFAAPLAAGRLVSARPR
jgi:hypothetical protein